MAIIYVQRESENQKTQLVALTQKDKDGNQLLNGSDAPVIVVDVNHQRLHEGRAFFASHIINNGSTLPNGSSINFVFAAGPGTTMHLTYGGACGGDAEILLYEGTTSTGGTSYTPLKRNRTSSTISNVAMVLNPTVNTTGTLIYSDLIIGGGKTKTGGGDTTSLEFVLLPLTNYMVRLTNTSGSNQVAVLTLEWYE